MTGKTVTALDRSAGEKPSILVIAGPTASGKTTIALALANAFGGELIGADSMQVFRYLNIGTATPTAEELGGIRHALINILEPDQPFDASQYVVAADQAIADCAARGVNPIVVGGTGLYIRALLHGLHRAPPPQEDVRAHFLAKAEQDGWPAMHQELARIDPKTAARLHPNDGVRIVRALEVLASSGIPMSEWQERHGFAKWRYRACILGIDHPREVLYRRIEDRVDQMMAQGFLDEVKDLVQRGFSRDLKPMQGLGYRQLMAHLAGETGLEDAVADIKKETRRFAKRQITWFKKELGLEWVGPDQDDILKRARACFAQGD
ncbi:MAG: tRNA (adenosine(37)-N6)-dimethylallyltransferase MiaA [Myxococcota bacterium]|nr:tRNA (adenosine(37)-N6)-dimethylallyltransferase MiaA [Myxococcota bacterium]